MSSIGPIDLRWRMESGEEHLRPAVAFVAGWTHNLGCFEGRETDVGQVRCFVGLHGVIGTEPRLRPFDEDGRATFDGDSIDDQGIRIRPLGRDLYVQIVDEQGREVHRFPAGDGVAVKAGPRIPIEGAGHYTQLLLTDLDGEVLATCYDSGWHDAEREPYPGGRGYVLYVADEGWLDLKDGHYRVETTPRRRPSALAASRVA